jgi:hypothetical protein
VVCLVCLVLGLGLAWVSDDLGKDLEDHHVGFEEVEEVESLAAQEVKEVQ